MLRLARGVRLQFERVANSHVLLFPEGVVELNHSAHAIVSKLPVQREVLHSRLRSEFSTYSAEEVDVFIEAAHRARWMCTTSEECTAL